MKLRTLLFGGLAAAVTVVLAANAQVPGVNSTLNSVFTLAYDNSTMKPTYSATRAGIVPDSAATDICTLSGSATKTVKVRRIAISGYTATAQTDPVAIIKRSTANTGGTGVALSAIAYDSTNSLTGSTTNTATAVAEAFTGNPTIGTQAGMIADVYIGFGAPTNASEAPHEAVFGTLGSPVVLRGIAQMLTVNLNGLTYAAPVGMSCVFEWTEE